MFSTHSQLLRRTPENGIDRENYLSQLVDEFLHSSSYEAKCQVLANLGNFAYDPLNYGYIRDVGVLDIFLNVIKTESDQKLVLFAISGVCNLCIDPENAEYILTYLGVEPLKTLLKSGNNEIITNTITTLLYLHNKKTDFEINTPEVLQFLKDFTTSDDKKLVNLSTLLLDVLNMKEV